MNIERNWYYWDKEDDEMQQVFTVNKDRAEGTLFFFSESLEDGSEFGLAVNVPSVEVEPSDIVRKTAQRSLDDYRDEHGS